MAKITDIKEQSGDASRVSIFINGEFALGISAAAATALKLKIGMEIEPDALALAANTDAAYSKALHYLSFRSRSAGQIRRYLADKEFAPQTVEAVIERLTQNRYIDDTEFALSLARSYRQKEGKKGIKSRLNAAGIDDEAIDAALEYDELPSCLAAARKYLRTRTFEREKLWRHLYTKGFSSDSIESAVSIIQKDMGEDDDRF